MSHIPPAAKAVLAPRLTISKLRSHLLKHRVKASKACLERWRVQLKDTELAHFQSWLFYELAVWVQASH